MWVQPKVDDRVNADCCLGEHGGDGKEVEGDGGAGDVASSLGNGHAGVR